MVKAPVFTSIIHTYNRPNLLREAVEATIRQTYDKLEIIIINDGATPETIEYLQEVSASDKRVRILDYEENLFRMEDPHRVVEVAFNDALKVAEGDYIWYQADDDLISENYAEEMVALLSGDPQCITAAGLSVAIDIDGNIIDSGPRTSNFRPRYMPGHLLALDVVRGGATMFSAPGTIFTMRREALIKAGGFHSCIEASQLFGIAPFGVTGFAEDAILYWRRHEGQLNKELTANGILGVDYTISMLRDWEIEQRWQQFGTTVASEVVISIEMRMCRGAAHWFALNFVRLRWRASWRILRDIWKRFNFWRNLPASFYKCLKSTFAELARRVLPAPIKRFLKRVL